MEAWCVFGIVFNRSRGAIVTAIVSVVSPTTADERLADELEP